MKSEVGWLIGAVALGLLLYFLGVGNASAELTGDRFTLAARFSSHFC
ncbi:hypothetical protein [Afifella pfennigii]|nr:hypothetical protein [Afifella pfennigii]